MFLYCISCFEDFNGEAVELLVSSMAGVRPGGLSDDEYSDDDQIVECDENVSKRYSDRDTVASVFRSEV